MSTNLTFIAFIKDFGAFDERLPLTQVVEDRHVIYPTFNFSP
jgi:hypothetical protein